jgi:hypothetical protein
MRDAEKMKINRFLNGFGAIAVAVLGMGLTMMPAGASAASIAGEIAFFGIFAPEGSGALGTATGMSFPDPVIIGEGKGDFAAAVGATASFSTITFAPPTTGLVLTFADGGSFTSDSVSVVLQNATQLLLDFTGVWTLDGYDATPGSLNLTGNSLGAAFTFSATGIAPPVPVPGALLLFGSALAGLGFTRRGLKRN